MFDPYQEIKSYCFTGVDHRDLHIGAIYYQTSRDRYVRVLGVAKMYNSDEKYVIILDDDIEDDSYNDNAELVPMDLFISRETIDHDGNNCYEFKYST